MGLFPLPKPLFLIAFLFGTLLILTSSSITSARISTTTAPSNITASSDDDKSVYEVLEEYDFPVGLLPKEVTGYELNRKTGEFSVYLDRTCTFDVEDYTLEYKSPIRGVISKGRLKKLKGVKVHVLLLWVSIVEVRRKGDDLEFSVGIASAGFSVNNFEESPRCGCGFDCDDGLVASD